jgi:hypothetical protein
VFGPDIDRLGSAVSNIPFIYFQPTGARKRSSFDDVGRIGKSETALAKLGQFLEDGLLLSRSSRCNLIGDGGDAAHLQRQGAKASVYIRADEARRARTGAGTGEACRSEATHSILERRGRFGGF